MTHSQLFQPVTLNTHLTLNNRIVMAPLTRSMADDNLVATEEMAAYYGRRADAGLIISEAILIEKAGQGYPNSPGLYNPAQIESWKRITDRVHRNGGKIFAQIWHTGRLSHSIYRNGQPPIAPSAVKWPGRVPQTDNLQYETPSPMTQVDIDRTVEAFATTAANALKAGFDGIELHGANGYLIDQFLHYSSNQRTDQYGETAENMTRFIFDILDAVKTEIPEQLTGLRLSPHAGIGEVWQVMEHDDRDIHIFEYLLKQLNHRQLAYVHKGMYDDCYIPHLGSTPSQFIRQFYQGNIITCGGFTPESAENILQQGEVDLVAFGRPFIANHDFVQRIANQQVLTPYDVSQLATLD